MKPGWAVGVAAIVALTAACANGHDSTIGTTPDRTVATTFDTAPLVTAGRIDDRPSGWLHTEYSAAIFLSFVPDSTGSLTGNISTAKTSVDGTDVEAGSYPLTGTINGAKIAVTFNDRTWTGSITEDSIILNVPQRDGTIAQGVWVRGSVDDYNAAVAKLQTGALTETAISVEAAEDAATASSLQAAADTEANRVASVYKRAVQDVSALDSTVAAIPAALADVDTAVADVKTATMEPALTGPCEYGAAAYALDSVDYARNSVTYAISSVSYITVNIPSTIADLRAQLDDLGHSAQTDDQVDVIEVGNAAIADANAAIAAADKSTAKSQATADALYSNAQAAEWAHCPGDASDRPVSTFPAEPTGAGSSNDSYPLSLDSHSVGPNVKHVQERLNAWGWAVAADGEFGPTTDDAVRQFQAQQGLDVDGYVGMDTLAALDAEPQYGE